MDALPVPPADTRVLWDRVVEVGELVYESAKSMMLADSMGLPVDRMESEHANLRMEHDILVREYNRRTAA